MCDNNRLLFDESIELADNAMLRHRPDLFNEWDFEKNDELGLDIYKVTYASGMKAWWICKNYSCNWEAVISSRVNGNNCPYCRGTMVSERNSLETLSPDITKEWHPSKNGEMSPQNTLNGSAKKVWWTCLKCESEFEAVVERRTSQSQGCPYCAGRKVNHTNSLSALNPQLASQWHPVLNAGLTPHDVTCGSHQIVWWLGDCGHEWNTVCKSRSLSENGCPYCSNKLVLKGYNDMWTTNPELAKQLSNPEDGLKYTQWSNKRVDWKCLDCGEEIKSKVISAINDRRLSCPVCSDGASYPEKIVFNVLRVLEIDFEKEKVFDWSGNNRYDFYLESYSTIIEVHGLQHYEEGFITVGGKSLSEEISNDKEKERKARLNGIENYYVVDARKSDIEYIQNSLEICGVGALLNLQKIDWSIVSYNSSSSLMKEAWDLWNSGVENVNEIGKMMGLGRQVIFRYLKQGQMANKCRYTPEQSIKNGYFKNYRKAVQLELDGTLVREWDNILEPSTVFNTTSGIVRCCKGGSQTAYGFKWMYFEDYERNIKDNIQVGVKYKENPNKKQVVQLSSDNVFIKEWESISSVYRELGLDTSSIAKSCKGKQKTTGGFKWMYAEDYYREAI